MIVDYLLVIVTTLLIGGFSIPIGLLLGLDPIGVYVAATAGSLLYMLLALAGGSWVRARLLGGEGSGTGSRVEQSRARALLDRFGVAGLAVIGGLVLGPSLTLLAAITLGVDRVRFAWWYAAATVIGFLVFTILWNLVL